MPLILHVYSPSCHFPLFVRHYSIRSWRRGRVPSRKEENTHLIVREWICNIGLTCSVTHVQLSLLQFGSLRAMCVDCKQMRTRLTFMCGGVSLKSIARFMTTFHFFIGALCFSNFLSLSLLGGNRPTFCQTFFLEGMHVESPKAMYTLWYKSNCLHVANLVRLSIISSVLFKVMRILVFVFPIGCGFMRKVDLCAEHIFNLPFYDKIDISYCNSTLLAGTSCAEALKSMILVWHLHL